MGNLIASAADVSHFFWDLLGPRPRLGLSAGTLKEMLDMQILDLVRGESRGEQSRGEQRRAEESRGALYCSVVLTISQPCCPFPLSPSALIHPLSVCIVPSPR
jgi:hypothetical protein